MAQELNVLIRRAIEVRERLDRTERAALRLREEWHQHRRRLHAAARRTKRGPLFRS